ncbi:Receptor-like protein Cf-9 [Glycine soja]|uniref:Receptor-like protein Cf-9 n=1 Tax=Glycine soja TaxID=3848 RepID=A0A445H1T5_GLYSO|nr:Receptor-like protein Cf-9 [Glycine soja]
MSMNNSLCWLLLPYFVFLLSLPSSFSSFCNHHDSSALLLFKNSLALNTSHHYYWFVDHYPWLHDYCSFSSKTESWKNGTDCCEWDGITCHIISGHVIGLDLSCSNLQGQLHPNSTIFSLRHLQQLNLAYNDFSGSSLYSAIGDLVNLMHLNLSYSQISGNIPSTISHLSKLLSLDLGSVYLTIEDPNYPRMRVDPYTWKKLIQNSTNLRELNLDGVEMSSIGESSLSLLTNLSFSLISLSLRDTKLQGNLSSDILFLPNLQILSLSDNKDLGGELPKSNWSTQLRLLGLSYTAFSGNIPDSIGHLRSLNILGLKNSNFDGMVPSSLFNLTQLFHLDLSDNHLTGSIGEFSSYSLELLSLSNNKLQANFLNSIFQFQNLTYLNLSSTDLSGHLDLHEFSKLKNLKYLDLSHNRLLSINFDSTADYILPNLQFLYLSCCNISSFPKFLPLLQNLVVLDLSHNSIRGSIPQWFHEKLLHSWKNIHFIDLSFNKLQGDLPIPPNGIGYFSVSNNELTGNFPSAMCNASSLKILNLAHNNLTGPIPQCLGTFPSLWTLDLQKNNLYGNIPGNFSKGNALETIKLNDNQLDGPLPRSLAHCTNLEVLDLADNNIEDTFPHWLESLQELQVLSLRSNKFHGVITCYGAKHPFLRLRIFDVSNNNFSGPLPTSYIKNFQEMMNVNVSQTGSIGLKNTGTTSNLYNDSVVVVMKGRYMELVRIIFAFMTIDLSNNMFEGELPKVIGELHSLKGLNLSHNAITGPIPRSFGNLRNLEWLDLSWNRLKGEIPVALINLNFLAVLNLSQNQFEGIIPTGGQFNTFGNDSYAGNPMLCGFPLSKSCNKDEDWPPHSTFHHEESGFGWKSVAVGFACGLVFGMLLGYNVFMTGKPQWLARLVEGVHISGVKRTNNRIHAN